MSKRHTLKEARGILTYVLLGALQHMESIKSELYKLKLKGDGTDDPNDVARGKVLTLTLVCINDIIHPAHKICYRYFKGADEIFDEYIKQHALARSNELVPKCQCDLCIEDKSKEEDVKSEMQIVSTDPESAS